MASFRDMARASKLPIAILALCCWVGAAHAQSGQSVGAQVAELQFALARSLAQAGEHEAAAREFDRAFALQREAETATPAQTDAALQTLRAYAQSRPELPRIGELGRRVAETERQMAATATPATLVPNAPIGAARAPTVEPPSPPTTATPLIVPNAPPVLAPARPNAPAPRPAVANTRATGAWWDQATIAADELLVPAEWAAAGLQRARRPGAWPQLLTGWPALLVPAGWDRPNPHGGSMLLAETELLVPTGW